MNDSRAETKGASPRLLATVRESKSQACCQIVGSLLVRVRSGLRLLGPGFITGASDDDPSGVVTYSQAGSRFGLAMLWTMLLTYPLMVAIQEMCARVGRVTGAGLSANIRRHYPRWLLYVLVALLFIANVINIGADIAAMGAATRLVVGRGSAIAYAVIFAGGSVALEILLSYRRYARFLMWLTASLGAYVIAAFVIQVPWREALRATLLPTLTRSSDYLVMIVAIFGTTISPYLFFWQASQEAEDVAADTHAKSLIRAPWLAGWQLRRLRVDTLIGMAASNLVGWFIVLTTAVTLHGKSGLPLNSAATAAAALEPLAGHFASLVFACGIVGTGLLTVPVLAGSASYALGEAMGLPVGIDRKPRDAQVFYGVITLATALGVAMNFLPVSPIDALVFAAVVNGVVAVPIMTMTILVGANRQVMREFVLPRGLRVLGWCATAMMALSVIAMFATLGR